MAQRLASVGVAERVRTRAVLSATVLLAAFAVGCGAAGNQPAPSSSASESTSAEAASSPPATDQTADTQDWPGVMVATYQDAISSEAKTGRDLIENDHLLEDLADGINQSLKLPYDIPLIGKECGEANAFWSSDEKSVTICYEDAADALDIYTDAGDADPATSAINSEIATFYHETGHMVIDLYDLPVTGREEDVADQLAAYILLTPGADGSIDPASVQAVKDFARVFKGYDEQKGGEIDQGALADVHSLDLTRMYNLECWVYGADPVGNADMVGDGLLPEDRADGCEDEYAKLSRSWDTLLGPYLK